MTPTSFSFELTVPKDPEGVAVVTIMVTHAVQYAAIEPTAGAAFVERVRAAAVPILKDGGQSCLVEFAAADGRLIVTIDGHALSEPLRA